MPLSALEICSTALEGVGMDAPSSLTSSDDLGRRLLGIVNALGQNLATSYDWQELRTEGTFTTTASQELQATFYADDSDFPNARKIVDGTIWNRTTQRRLLPLSQRAWSRIKADGASPATEVYYFKGGQMLFPLDTVTGGETIAFEYIDKRWCETADGNTQLRRFAGDTNVPRIDDHLFVLGVRWRYLKSIGMEYGEEFREYGDYLRQKQAEDQPRENLSLNPYASPDGFDGRQIPEGNWNV